MISQDTEINISNIWFEDKLNRKGYADFLYQVIASAETSETEDNALIFAIDGEWGTGKSFFINCWMRDLEAKGHLVSRFDAWKNDIVDEPLIGFLSHIYADLERWDKKRRVKFAGESIKKSQKRLLPIAQELVKGAGVKALGYLVTDEIAKEVAKSIAEGAKQVIDNEEDEKKEISSFSLHAKLKAHNKNIQLIEEFKSELSIVAKDLVENKEAVKDPVFIFIDELDRCRPDYGVRLLEVVKHIFNSKGICFVSSVNLNQLKESIKTIYGVNFDADRYLDRFFNHRLKLPAPTIKDYISSLDEFRSIRDAKGSLLSDSRGFDKASLDFYNFVCCFHGFDLRTIKSLISRLSLCVKIIKCKDEIFHHDEILFVIICLIKTGNFKNRIFLDGLSNFGDEFGKLKYFHFQRNASGYFSIEKNWGEFHGVFRLISQISINSGTHNMRIEHSQYRFYLEVMDSFGLSEGQEKEIFIKLNKYFDVCEMSGRLES
ncbi:KAP family P-loop NTPase fold protein [Comamonas aquatica]|uniref:KAP family P-loop NTPase fold protein n=1 Tax=Comamonas aquatica TaxID=225991 RepID=UPI003D081AB8